jgi:ATP-dependent RNA helicase SUPV3L1/SUV3
MYLMDCEGKLLVKKEECSQDQVEIEVVNVQTTISFTVMNLLLNTDILQGFVTTFKPEDLKTLKYLLSQLPEPIMKAGLHPTAEQIELYAYHLPNSTLSNLMVLSSC